LKDKSAFMDDVTKNQMDNDEFPFGFRRQPVSDDLLEANWRAVEDRIRRQDEVPVRTMESRVIRWVSIVRVTAVAASLAAVAFGVWWIAARTGHAQYAVIRTGYGEIKNVLLPDSTVVTLNANSSMRMPEQWNDADGRQVWLEGEAYFQVQKKPSTVEKFVVHTRQVDVEVLGTRFNVNTRRQRAVVSLEEGKVRLSVHEGDSAVLEKKAAMIMRPGQVVVIGIDRKPSINLDKDVATRSGWTRHAFHFDNTSLGEIAAMVEDTYGYKMEAEDSSMLRFAISGDVRVRNIEEMVQVLEASSGYAMRIDNKTIYVSRH
jgi:ferric-dicitrate binding protein FerR (iron transport regulator)